jgi:hypothetical protein
VLAYFFYQYLMYATAWATEEIPKGPFHEPRQAFHREHP